MLVNVAIVTRVFKPHNLTGFEYRYTKVFEYYGERLLRYKNDQHIRRVDFYDDVGTLGVSYNTSNWFEIDKTQKQTFVSSRSTKKILSNFIIHGKFIPSDYYWFIV